MSDVERMELTLADLRERGPVCLACDGDARGGDAPRDAAPVLAAGVDLTALEDYLPAWPLCAGCLAAERAGLRRAGRLRVALGVLPPALGLGASLLYPFELALAPALGVALGAIVSALAVRRSAGALGRGLPVVVTRAEGDRLELVRPPRRRAGGDRAGPYRAPPRSGDRPAAPVAIRGGAWPALIGAAICGVLAWVLTSLLYPPVRFDSGSFDDMVVEIDGERTVAIGARGSVEIGLRYGTHRLRVRYADEVTDGELMEVTLPFGEPHVLAVDGEACFVRSHTSESRVHRWSSLVTTTTWASTQCGRWLAIGSGEIARAR